MDRTPRPAEAVLLSVEGLSVFHGQLRAVDRVDLTVAAGEIVAIIGANGAGKSTLLTAIVGQGGRVEGRIRYAGADLAGRPTASIVASGIALVPEGRRLFPSLTVAENLQLGWEVGRKGDIGLDDVFQLFPVLRERRRQKASQLSGGQQQMVALGRALLANPRLLLCDEISLGLAPIVVNDIYAIIPAIKARGIGIVIVEQDISRALAVADRFYCLLEGRVTRTGRPAETNREDLMQYYFGTPLGAGGVDGPDGAVASGMPNGAGG